MKSKTRSISALTVGSGIGIWNHGHSIFFLSAPLYYVTLTGAQSINERGDLTGMRLTRGKPGGLLATTGAICVLRVDVSRGD